MLTDIPVGAWTVALGLDALESISGRKECGSAADLAIGVGLLGAIGSAITGVTDWSEIDGRARKIGLVHGALNVVSTTLYAMSFFMRKGRRTRSSGVALSMLGFAIASSAAYLGGHLTFGEQIGVDHTATADATKPEKFKRVLKADELKALLDKNPNPTEDEIRWWLAGNLCRCTGYDKIVRAVQNAAKQGGA